MLAPSLWWSLHAGLAELCTWLQWLTAVLTAPGGGLPGCRTPEGGSKHGDRAPSCS